MKNNMGLMLIVGIVVGAALSAMIFTMFNAGMPTGAAVGSFSSITGPAIEAAAPLVAIRGIATTGIGLEGRSTSGDGVKGTSSNSAGVEGTSTSGNGVKGTSTSSAGVEGLSTSGPGLRGNSGSSYGVHGVSTGSTYSTAGVYGQSTTAATGVYGYSTRGIGVYGKTDATLDFGGSFWGGRGVYSDKGYATKSGTAIVTGVSGTFKTSDGKTITIVNGIVTGITGLTVASSVPSATIR